MSKPKETPRPYKVLGMDGGREKRLYDDGEYALVKPDAPANASQAGEESAVKIKELEGQILKLADEKKAAQEQVKTQAAEIERLTAMVEAQAAEIETLKNESAAKPADKPK